MVHTPDKVTSKITSPNFITAYYSPREQRQKVPIFDNQC